MTNVTLHDGRVVGIDLHRIPMREFRKLLDTDQPQAEGDATLAKAVGLSVDELLDLSQPDYRALVTAFFKAAREPLADPNSASASSSA
jgi:hypothetical protein